MSWTGSKELRARMARLWDRGELLRDAVTGHVRFPLRLPLNSPSSADITGRFHEVRAWAAELAATESIRVEWEVLKHRIQGTQQIPRCAWVETTEDALAWLGKRQDWDLFMTLLQETKHTHPALLPWLERHPLQALSLHTDWARLLRVLAWFAEHPRPGIYLRQVDLPGLHSKFIETHRKVLAELLDLVLPAEVVDRGKTGIQQFAARYGFLDKPTRVRFRVLDPNIKVVPGSSCPDVTLDAESFSRLKLPVNTVFITENETNFLAFPPVKGALVVFGAGYGWDALARGVWLKDCSIYYWGDIDTHGFGILNQLRGHFDHVASFLMDRSTLDAHAWAWGFEEQPLQMDLHRLTLQEGALYNELRDNRIRSGLRLEQEHIGFRWLMDRLTSQLAQCRAGSTAGQQDSE